MKKDQLRLLQRIANATYHYETACSSLWENPADMEAADKAQVWDMEAFLLRQKYDAIYC